MLAPVTAFEDWLRLHYGPTPPIGYCLRSDHDHRWLRLHSLPGSKRYAGDDAERAEVRHRARTAASHVLPADGPVWLVTHRYTNTESPPAVPPLDFEPAGSYVHDLLGDAPMLAYAAQTSWPHDGFDALIDAIAADVATAVWFSADTGEAFAPYDGGIDLILSSHGRARSLRTAFPSHWFSPRADGL